MTDQTRPETRQASSLERFLGGSPGGVAVRLLLGSLAVGFAMSLFGLGVGDIIRGTVSLFREALRDGLGAMGDLGGYILTGAALVIPVWLLVRLTKAR